MKKKGTAQSAFLNLCAVILSLFWTAAACSMVTGTLLAFLRPDVSAEISQRTLTFTERVAYQRAIEEVYWQHRLWPKDNPQPKPPLEAIVSEAQLEKKVEDYLRKSRFVADQRGWPITASELQAEMDRMAQHTKRPEVLRELFAALGNDPFVIAESLARPALAQRLGANLIAEAGVSPAARSSFGAGTAASKENGTRVTANLGNAAYKLPEIPVATDCPDDTWTATTIMSAPDARWGHTAVWTGGEMIVWGGNDGNGTFFNTGGKYNPATDSWTATSTTNAPIARWHHTALWTGSEMVVWGGSDNTDLSNTGGRYNPVMDSWIVTNTANAPTARDFHTAVWTGSEMIVWGGYPYIYISGGRYSPATDSWTATSTTNAPSGRWLHTAVWTGNQMIIWGGTNQTNYLHTGGKYNPSGDSWTATGTVNVPLGRIAHTAVWTGGEMIVWGGVDETFNDTNSGGRYDPSTDAWTATSLSNAPSARDSHSAVWSGGEMIVWGGVFLTTNLDTGGRYEAGTDSWMPTSTTNPPVARENHTAVWAGTEMIVWGGLHYPSPYLNTGGRYCAQSGATPTPTPTPTATATPTAMPTATPTSTPRATPTPRIAPTPRSRPTPRPRP
jgi:N-acetylneuraminic acid mutarotase